MSPQFQNKLNSEAGLLLKDKPLHLSFILNFDYQGSFFRIQLDDSKLPHSRSWWKDRQEKNFVLLLFWMIKVPGISGRYFIAEVLFFQNFRMMEKKFFYKRSSQNNIIRVLISILCERSIKNITPIFPTY